jgi:branched-chain amino acid transport system substrate-binding protein
MGFGLILVACQRDQLACSDPLGCLVLAPGEPVRVAALLPENGAAAYLGEDARRGVELAIAAEGGSLLNHPLELLTADSACQAEPDRRQITTLLATAPDLVGIIGPLCSSAAEGMLPVVSRAGLVMISPANTAVALTTPTAQPDGLWQPGYYRTAPNNAFQAQLAATFARQVLAARTAAIIGADLPQTQELADAFARSFRQLGGSVIAQGRVLSGETDLTELLDGITAVTPDVIYLAVFEPEGNLIMNRVADFTSLTGEHFIGSEGLFSESFASGVGAPMVRDMYVVGPAPQGEAYDALRQEWQNRYDVLPSGPFHAHAYDATRLLLAAIRSSAQVSSGGELVIGRQALRDALTQTAVFPGVTGNLTCSPYGDCAADTAVGLYQLSTAEISGENWPPELVWRGE